MAARKTAKAPKHKAATKAPAAKRSARSLPNDAAWRALIETALEKPDADTRQIASGDGHVEAAKDTAAQASTRKSRKKTPAKKKASRKAPPAKTARKKSPAKK